MSVIGEHCPTRLFELDTYVALLEPLTYDDQGHERGKRINGFCECPRCGAWWPCIEEPDAWEEDASDPGRWYAIEWWGAAICLECDLLMIEQPDGTPEVYRL